MQADDHMGDFCDRLARPKRTPSSGEDPREYDWMLDTLDAATEEARRKFEIGTDPVAYAER
jgi:hypothetical protein